MTTSRLGNKFHSIHTMRWVNNGYFLFQLFAKICEFATLDIYLILKIIFKTSVSSLLSVIRLFFLCSINYFSSSCISMFIVAR